MCATKAVYHKKCLTDCYNNYRKTQKQSHLNENHDDIEGWALLAVVEWLKDSLASCLDDEKIPVFSQKDIVAMYKEKLHERGAVVLFVHCTRLTKKILIAVPGIIATRSSQSSNSPVVLTLDGELGKAIFQAYIHSSFDDVLVMADVARRIRKVLFCDIQTFNSDTSFESQASSLPNILIRLISMILEGGKTDRELNSSQTRIACNIAQIIKFNSVKEKSKVTTINSRNNEPTLPVVVGLNIHFKTKKKSLIEDLHTKGLSISYERVMNIRSSML